MQVRTDAKRKAREFGILVESCVSFLYNQITGMIGSAMQIRLSLDGPWFVPHGSAAKSAACRGKGKEGRTKNMDAPDKIIAYYNNSNDEDLYLFMTLTNLIKADYGRRYIDPLIEELYD